MTGWSPAWHPSRLASSRCWRTSPRSSRRHALVWRTSRDACPPLRLLSAKTRKYRSMCSQIAKICRMANTRVHVTWYDTMRHDMTCYDMLWHDMLWYSVIWHDVHQWREQAKDMAAMLRRKGFNVFYDEAFLLHLDSATLRLSISLCVYLYLSVCVCI